MFPHGVTINALEIRMGPFAEDRKERLVVETLGGGQLEFQQSILTPIHVDGIDVPGPGQGVVERCSRPT